VFGELGPSSAITGGVLSQEVVKAVSQKDPPLVNIFLCNPMCGTGYVENLIDT
jgi:ubiquitin-like 1-activating enzyme E1 A